MCFGTLFGPGSLGGLLGPPRSSQNSDAHSRPESLSTKLQELGDTSKSSKKSQQTFQDAEATAGLAIATGVLIADSANNPTRDCIAHVRQTHRSIHNCNQATPRCRKSTETKTRVVNRPTQSDDTDGEFYQTTPPTNHWRGNAFAAEPAQWLPDSATNSVHRKQRHAAPNTAKDIAEATRNCKLHHPS